MKTIVMAWKRKKLKKGGRAKLRELNNIWYPIRHEIWAGGEHTVLI